MIDILWFIGAFIVGLIGGISLMFLVVLPSMIVQVAAETKNKLKEEQRRAFEKAYYRSDTETAPVRDIVRHSGTVERLGQ